MRHILIDLGNRLRAVIARGILNLVDDGDGVQIVQASVLAGEVRSGLEHLQPYGFKSVPLAGAEVLLVFPNGSRDHGYAVVVADRRHRPTGWTAGEVGMFTDEAGNSVRFKRGGELEIVASTKLTLSAPTIEINGTTVVAIDGTALVTIDGTIVNLQAKGNYENHIHDGVSSGLNNTGDVV